MNKILIIIFLLSVKISNLLAQDTPKTSNTRFDSRSQDLLMIEYQKFIRQMELDEKNPDYKGPVFINHYTEIEKKCGLYQHKWSYFCRPGGSVWVMKGDSSSLPLCQVLKEKKQSVFVGYSIQGGGKYIVRGYSRPMGTCDDEFHYYERVDKK